MAAGAVGDPDGPAGGGVRTAEGDLNGGGTHRDAVPEPHLFLYCPRRTVDGTG
ncbi:hypothetical protein JS756_00330 [Streptomyces actuosus]|uniref:Uncharacterized protein n=1 Tax=Streptomyces actuosus TaxID=1885 RepID=A0ABS2VHM3_STRAS|nr:hypothetical protein [Streptomyces actuosus]MBN0042580.1 hypothetical protein [Streptomyces actuosus]